MTLQTNFNINLNYTGEIMVEIHHRNNLITILDIQNMTKFNEKLFRK